MHKKLLEPFNADSWSSLSPLRVFKSLPRLGRGRGCCLCRGPWQRDGLPQGRVIVPVVFTCSRHSPGASGRRTDPAGGSLLDVWGGGGGGRAGAGAGAAAAALPADGPAVGKQGAPGDEEHRREVLRAGTSLRLTLIVMADPPAARQHRRTGHQPERTPERTRPQTSRQSRCCRRPTENIALQFTCSCCMSILRYVCTSVLT